MDDVSNPVIDQSRCLVANLRARALLRVRQDFATLTRKTQLAERVVLETPLRQDDTGPDFDKLVNKAYKYLRTDTLPVVMEEVSLADLPCLEVATKGVAVCGLQYEGARVHAPGRCERGIKGKEGDVMVVSVKKSWGGGLRPCYGLEEILQHYSYEDVLESGRKILYTWGMPEDFKKCVQKQMGMPTKSIKSIFQNEKKNLNSLVEILDREFDFEGGVLPSWEGPLEDLLSTVYTSADASAGAPYWKPKSAAYEEMMCCVLPKVVGALKEKNWEAAQQKLLKEQPELFLCELKNKLDRYELSQLKEKCRPYVSMPFHFSVLFSFLCQHFCDQLTVAGKDNTSHNALGFAAVEGGLSGLRERMVQLGKGGMDYYCYGDDTDVYYRDREGVLWRISPDFTQMDGSLDFDTIYLTVRWVYGHFAKQHGANLFWQNVGKEWINMAYDPMFVFDGPTVYRKKGDRKAKGGMMSGVVGTTLFNTVKSVLTYRALIDRVVGWKTLDAKKLFDAKFMEKYFLNEFGLVIKPGTWKWHKVQEKPVVGELWSPTKFLGALWKYVEVGTGIDLMPTLDTDSFLQLLLNPRRDEETQKWKKEKQPVYQNTVEGRYVFDWARGLFLTCGFNDDTQRSCLNSIINSVPGASVVMQVMANNGLGEVPEAVALAEKFGGDNAPFNYCDSGGMPTEQWVKELYASPENRHVCGYVCQCACAEAGYPEVRPPNCGCNYQSEWRFLYPSLAEWAIKQKWQNRALNPLMLIKSESGPAEKAPVAGVAGVVEMPLPPKMEVVNDEWALVPTPRTSKSLPAKEPEQREKVNVVAEAEAWVEKPVKRDPTFGRQLKALMKRLYSGAVEEVRKRRGNIEEKHGLKASLQIKYPKWKEFGVPVKQIELMTGWHEGQVHSAADELGMVIQDNWIMTCVPVNDRVATDLVESRERAEKRVRSPVVTTKDKAIKQQMAEQALLKFDGPEMSPPKAAPVAHIQWFQARKGVVELLRIVRDTLKEVSPQQQTSDGYWGRLCTETYVMPEINGVVPRFRLMFRFEHHVEQGKQGQIVTTKVSLMFQNYTMCVYGGQNYTRCVFEEDMERYCLLCRVQGSDKRWNVRVLKNALLRQLYPEGIPVLYLLEKQGVQYLTSEAKGKVRKAVSDTFAVGTPTYSNWYEAAITEESAAVRTPFVHDPEGLVFNTPWTVLNVSRSIYQGHDPEKEVFEDDFPGEEREPEDSEGEAKTPEGGSETFVLQQILQGLSSSKSSRRSNSLKGKSVASRPQ